MKKQGKVFMYLGGLLCGGYALYKVLSGKEPAKYSLRWIENLTNDEWEKEREILQEKFRNPQNDSTTKDVCGRLLDLFDKVKSKRDWNGQTPRGQTYHREHGGIAKKED